MLPKYKNMQLKVHLGPNLNHNWPTNLKCQFFTFFLVLGSVAMWIFSYAGSIRVEVFWAYSLGSRILLMCAETEYPTN